MTVCIINPIICLSIHQPKILQVKVSAMNAVVSQDILEDEHQAVFSALRAVADSIAALFPGLCEVVIHNLLDMDHSAIYIIGNITGRKIGSPMTDLGVKALRDGQVEKLSGYITHTKDGKILRCSAPFIRDRQGNYFAAMAINVDVSILAAMQTMVSGLFPLVDQPVDESFSNDLDEVITQKITLAAARINKPVGIMDRQEKLKLVSYLDQEGVFNWRNAVPKVAEILGVTRSTIYNYIKEVSK